MNELAVVHERIARLWATDSIIILGDFNADCGYLSQRQTDALPLRSDPKFQWLISDDTDTTVTNSDCAYDRWALINPKFYVFSCTLFLQYSSFIVHQNSIETQAILMQY